MFSSRVVTDLAHRKNFTSCLCHKIDINGPLALLLDYWYVKRGAQRNQLPQTKRHKLSQLASYSLVPRLIASPGTRLAWAGHAWEARAREILWAVYARIYTAYTRIASQQFSVHVRHVILARVGYNWHVVFHGSGLEKMQGWGYVCLASCFTPSLPCQHSAIRLNGFWHSHPYILVHFWEMLSFIASTQLQEPGKPLLLPTLLHQFCAVYIYCTSAPIRVHRCNHRQYSTIYGAITGEVCTSVLFHCQSADI